MSNKARAFVFTVNNWTEEDIMGVQLLAEHAQYLVYGKEVGKCGTPHLQGYVYFKNARTWNIIQKHIPRCYKAKAFTLEEGIAYCKKEGDFHEFGVEPKAGRRTDLDAVKEEIVSGKRVDDIVLENPSIFHQYGRTLSKIEDVTMRKRFRTEMTEGIWYIGETGAGKSHKAFEGFTPETHYVYPYDGDWCDGYAQQETLILNEFRGQIAYSRLLELVDKWPASLRRRGREPMPFTSKRVIVTSKMHPRDVYKNLSEHDTLDQLLRRFKIYEVGKDHFGNRTYTLV